MTFDGSLAGKLTWCANMARAQTNLVNIVKNAEADKGDYLR